MTHFTGRVLQVRILGGDHAGETAFIPRITLTPSNLDLPFKLERRQFPVRLAFAMSINKAQGQSVKQVGLNLQSSVFTHGQLYVALSRSTTKQGVKAIFPHGRVQFLDEHSYIVDKSLAGNSDCSTQNIVYPEVLLD